VHIHAKKGSVWALAPVKGKLDTFTLRAVSLLIPCPLRAETFSSHLASCSTTSKSLMLFVFLLPSTFQNIMILIFLLQTNSRRTLAKLDASSTWLRRRLAMKSICSSTPRMMALGASTGPSFLSRDLPSSLPHHLPCWLRCLL
jgi:hypothetical protein